MARMKPRRSVLVVSPIPTHPPDAGNRARLNALLSRIAQAGLEVHLLFLDKGHAADRRAMARAWSGYHRVFHGRNPLRKGISMLRVLLGRATPFLPGAIDAWLSGRLRRKARPMGIDDWYDTSLDRAVDRLLRERDFDVVMVEYVYLSRVLERFGSGVLKIIDTHDAFSDRHLQFERRGRAPVFFYTSREEEARGLRRADLVLAIQASDARFFEEISGREVLCVGHLPECAPPRSVPDGPVRRLLYVATDTVPNQDAMDFFLSEIWPEVRRRHPGVAVDVVGGICHYLKGRVDEHFNLHYRVEDLSSFLGPERIAINPVRIGTGLKIKNVEALFSGMPLVTTSVGAQGLESWSGRAFLLADSAGAFVDALDRLLGEEEARVALSREALAFADGYRQAHDRAVRKLLSRMGVK